MKTKEKNKDNETLTPSKVVENLTKDQKKELKYEEGDIIKIENVDEDDTQFDVEK